METFVFGLGPFGERLLTPGDHEGTERILGMALIAVVFVLLYPLSERKRRAERALLTSQALYRALVENVEDGVVRVGANGVVDYASPAAARLVGLTPQQIVGLHFATFVHPDDSSRVEASFARSMNGSAELTSLRLVGASGEVRLVRTSSRLLIQDGQPSGILGVVTDLTDQRQNEERLRQLSRAVEASSSVVVITDRSGLITYVNPKFTEVTGYRADEVLGQNPRILKSGEMPPDTYQEMWDTVAAGREWRGEFYNRRKDGSSYWESASISAVHDEAGDITHFVAVKEDITARKLAERAMTESEEKYRLLFSRQFDAAALVDDENGRFIEVNDAFRQLFGWSQQELGEMRVEALWADGNPSVSLSEGTTRELWCRRRDGTTFAVELAAGSFSWHGRSVTCLILRDITERIESQRRLEELSVTDGLTGLANRRAFDTQLEKEWRRAVRTRSAVALIMADLDHFKAFNDTCGHLEGDACLRKVAAVLARATRRAADLSARYGGEEFAVLLSDTTWEAAVALAEVLRVGVESLGIAPRGAGSGTTRVTLSLGVAMACPHEGADPHDLIRSADEALYQAKRKGRNRVETERGRTAETQAAVVAPAST
jgi:diguanylate cyclase (GGDEF)-like protein/PAS domain S-box-containing protein